MFTPASMLEEPSRGSKTTAYLPFSPSSCMRIASSSSWADGDKFIRGCQRPIRHLKTRFRDHYAGLPRQLECVDHDFVRDYIGLSQSLSFLALLTCEYSRISSFFWSSPVLLAVPAAPILQCSHKPSAIISVVCMDRQIEQSGSSDVHGDCLAGCLDGLQEQSEVSGRLGPQHGLFLQHMASNAQSARLPITINHQINPDLTW